MLDVTDFQLPCVATAVAKELSQHNLQVLKEALVCVDDFVGSWSLHPLWKDTLLSSTAPEFTSLLFSILQLLRHSNRGVTSSAREILKKWFLLDANDSPESIRRNNGSFFFRLICTNFQEALKFKPNSLDALLLWLADDLLTFIARRWALLFLTGGFLAAFDCDIRDESLSYLLQTLAPLFSHRDEKTREAALTAMSHLFALDNLWFQLLATSATAPLSLHFISIPATSSLLEDQMSPVTAEFFKGLSAASSWRRAEGRVLQTVAGFLRKTTAVGSGEGEV